MKLKSIIAATAATVGLTIGALAQAQEVRIGLLTTLTGPLAALGQHVRDGFALAVEEAGGKLGGVSTKVMVEDDQLRPDVAVQLATKLAERVKAEFGRPSRIEGLPTADWVLIDTGDVIIHLFRPEVRAFYNIEKIWSVETGGHRQAN
jgi:hypothetical protein